jgi:hypothetical protein
MSFAAPGGSAPMAEFKDREHFVSLRVSDLIDLLCSDTDLATGQRLTHEETLAFRRLCRHVSQHYHLVYFQHFEKLKEAYSPFDPDADTRPLVALAEDERQARLDRLFQEFDWLMERANYRKITRDDIKAATEEVSHWGLNMDVDLEVFDRLELYYRGDTTGRRTRRHYRNLFRLEEVRVPVYQRLVLILKQRAHKRLGKSPDTRNVFLKLFKDMPQMDIEMLIPGAELRMPKLQRGKLGASLASTVGFIAWKIFKEFHNISLGNPLTFYGPLSLVLGYGYRQWYGFQSMRQSYSLQLTQSLYYQNLDNNSGVFHRLLDAAEEQECREAVLAYFMLWRYGREEGWTPEALDDYVELYLERRANLAVDFEIGDALGKLEQLRFAERRGQAYFAVPIEHAMRRLSDEDTRYVTDGQMATP